jgi:hypothetical protein
VLQQAQPVAAQFYPSQSSSQPQLSQVSSAAFQSLVERSVAAWKTLRYVGNANDKESDFALYSGILEGFGSLDDLLDSIFMFWFFQCCEAFNMQ